MRGRPVRRQADGLLRVLQCLVILPATYEAAGQQHVGQRMVGLHGHRRGDFLFRLGKAAMSDQQAGVLRCGFMTTS